MSMYTIFNNCQSEIINHRIRGLILFLSIWGVPYLCSAAEAEWTFLVYAQANNSLCPFAQKNFNDMASIGSNKDLNILVQWHDPSHNGIWRYKMENGKMNLDMHLPVNIDGNSAKDLVDSMNWAVTKHPAKKYALILWNHGIGILDPAWGSQSMGFLRSDATQNNPRANIEGLTFLSQESAQESVQKLSKKQLIKGGHRGILFNERTKTYMNNQTLTSALSAIKTSVLKNKNLDILGMDACLMAMVEVCYQIRNYADYFVGSEEVELAFGWSYAPVLQRFIDKPSPYEAAAHIVHSYENLYKNKINFYSQSAVDLKLMNDLRNSINVIVQNLMTCREIDQNRIVSTIKQARNRSLQFSTTSYIDLHSFLQELQKSVSINLNKNVVKNATFLGAITELSDSIDITLKFIEQAVIANASGKQLSRAKGLSIYFPTNGPIDQSYMYTDFASDSAWNTLLLMAYGY
ncbi:hypothetical protein FJ364_01065 [Candidatus Dependentiae bacterium]|nr:hypothetical protein [Candidatus Dependentiae bacterium]